MQQHNQNSASEQQNGGAPATAQAPESARVARWNGWQVPVVGAVLAIIVVFAVLDATRLLSPMAHIRTLQPIIIHVQQANTTQPTRSALSIAPHEVTLACNGAATLTLTNPTGHALRWSLAPAPDGLSFTVDTARAGSLNAGEQVALSVLANGRGGAQMLRVTDDRGGVLDVPVTVQCP